MLETTSNQIKQIIAQRLPLGERIKEVEANLKLLQEKLQQLENYRQQILSISSNLETIDYISLINKLDREINVIKQLKARFERKTLNLGVIGRAGQGKSRLLQSLSGLTNTEIPTGDRQHCTGVRCTIYHHPHSETYGEIWFHSQTSFLQEVIYPYYDRLQLGLKPPSLDSFANQPLPLLPENLTGNAVAGAMYEHLSNYHINLPKYRHLLRVPLPTLSPKQKLDLI